MKTLLLQFGSLQEAIRFIFLAIHISTGGLSLLFGLFPLIGKKGSVFHQNTGKVFVYAMYACCLSGILLSILGSSIFLLLIGIFSGYLTLSGHLAIRNIGKDTKAIWKGVAIIGLIAAASMLCLGLYFLYNGEWEAALLQGVFGGSLFINALADYKMSNNLKHNSKHWLGLHIGRIIGGYIAATTAFLVVNNLFSFFPLINWFAPNVVLIPPIVYWMKKIKQVAQPPA